MDAAQRTIVGRRSIAALGALLVALGAVAISPAASAGAQRAQIVVHPGDGLRTVHPGLFGVNHRYPYEGFGMWDPSIDNVYPRFEHRFSAAGFTAMRFPGGSVANTYHWKRAIGPPSQRGLNVHGHTGQPLTNGFGPDEFGSFVSSEGIQAMMLANFATGTAQEAADWVEYMNAPVGTNPNGGTAWASVRAANGHPEPYHVQNWEIGNELYQPGQSYWMGAGSLATRTKKYIFGGSTSFKDQRVGKPTDHGPSAAVSDGSADQDFQVWYPPVRPDKPFEITVDDQGWSRVSDLSNAPADAKVYELDPATGKITFGDGVHGAIPPRDSVVRASYESGPARRLRRLLQRDEGGRPDDPGRQLLLERALPLDDGHQAPVRLRRQAPLQPPAASGPPQREAVPRRDHVDRGQARERGDSAAARHQPPRRGQGQVDRNRRLGVRDVVRPPQGPDAELPRLDGPGHLQRARAAALDAARNPPGRQAGPHVLQAGGTPPIGATSLGPPEQALIGPKPRYVMTATARAFRLLTPNAGNELVRAGIRGNPSRDIYTGKDLKMLSAVATKTSGGALYLTIVNKARAWRVPATVKVLGKRIRSAVTKELVGPSYLSYNSYHHPGRVSIRTHKQWVKSRTMKLKVPAHSVMTLKLRR